jgi:pyruvate,water dikinase
MTQPYDFTPPGPGTWEMDAGHVHKPMFGVVQEVFGYALSTGMADGCARYGLALDTLHVDFVHGFPYVQPKPVVGPANAKPPPRFIFRLAAKLHPTIRKRMKTAETLFDRRPWRDELREWDERVKPETIALHRQMAAIDPTGFDDHTLADHLFDMREHVKRIGAQDHTYTLTYAIPVGDFLAHAGRWTGMTPAELLKLFRGSSDISGGDSDERRALVDSLRKADDAREMLKGERDALAALASLREREDEVGEAARAFFDVHGGGIAHGIAVTIPTINEDPGPTLEALVRSAETAPRQTNGVASLEASVRGRVPAEHHERFDRLLEDARLLYRLRDERHLYGVLPTIGPARRALLEAARRLAERGAVDDVELVLFAETPEVADALRGQADLPIEELTTRRRKFEELDASVIPLQLGPDAPPPPPADFMPNEGARRLMDALQIFLGHGDDVTDARSAGEHVDGLPVSGGIAEGTARLCVSPEDLKKIQPGDVLLAPTTTSAINVVLPLVSAIVTDRGGALCHAAIVTREFGIPGVVGTRLATERIPDGARVRVNGDTGHVEVLS